MLGIDTVLYIHTVPLSTCWQHHAREGEMLAIMQGGRGAWPPSSWGKHIHIHFDPNVIDNTKGEIAGVFLDWL